MSENNTSTTGLPKLAKSTIWMINFGYLGVQTAFTLQSSQMSRIFQTIQPCFRAKGRETYATS